MLELFRVKVFSLEVLLSFGGFFNVGSERGLSLGGLGGNLNWALFKKKAKKYNEPTKKSTKTPPRKPKNPLK